MKIRLLIVLSLFAFQCSFANAFEGLLVTDPTAPTLPALTYCDSNNDGLGVFNLTDQNATILAAQSSAASNYVVRYYENLTNAQTGANPLTSPYYNINPNTQTIYYRITNINTNAFAFGSFQLVINAPVLLITPTPLGVCDSDAIPNNQYTTFNLTVKNTEITQGLSGYTVTYFPSLSNAQTGTNTITNPMSYVNTTPTIQTLGVKVTGPSGCSSITTLNISVLPIPTPNIFLPALAPKCDVNNPGDMVEVFDLTVNAAYIVNGDTNVTLHYYRTITDAEYNINEILTPTAALVGSNVWIRVDNNLVDYQGNKCYVLVEQPLTVNPLPTIIQPLATYRACDDNADGIATFDLTNPYLAANILGPSQIQGSYGISYHATPSNAASGIAPLPSTYLNVNPYSQTIYMRVVNNATGCVNATGQLTLAVENHATATGPQSYATCDDYADPNDGVVSLDLTQYASAILNGQNPAVFQLSYYTSQYDAVAGVNALTMGQVTGYQNLPYTDTIWVKVENSSNSITPLCYALTTINISVTPYPNPIITTTNNLNTVYVDASHNVVQSLLLNSEVTGNYIYQWYLNGSLIAGATNSTYLVNSATPNNESRVYSVNVVSNNALACSGSSVAFLVLQSNDVPPPIGSNYQSFAPGATLANIVVNGTNVQWYATATNKMTTSTPLPLNTPLVDGTTYYATQTIGGVESIARLPVTVYLTLGVNENEIFPIRYAPNPVKDNLTLQSSVVLKSVLVYTMLGQKVFEQNDDSTTITIDLSRLSAGNYIVKVQGETGQKTLRIIKE